jgi:hypothetical protein
MFKDDGRVLFKGYGVAITDNDNIARSNNSFSDVSSPWLRGI